MMDNEWTKDILICDYIDDDNNGEKSFSAINNEQTYPTEFTHV